MPTIAICYERAMSFPCDQHCFSCRPLRSWLLFSAVGGNEPILDSGSLNAFMDLDCWLPMRRQIRFVTDIVGDECMLFLATLHFGGVLRLLEIGGVNSNNRQTWTRPCSKPAKYRRDVPPL